MMEKVVIITEAEALRLRGKQFAPRAFYNPIQDADGNWVLSETEAVKARVEDGFLKTRQKLTHKPRDYAKELAEIKETKR